MALGGLGGGRGLDVGRGRDGLSQELFRQLANAFEVECVEKLEGKHELLQFDLPVGAFEDAGAARDGQVGVLVGQVGALHGEVAVFAEVEAENGLVAVALLLGDVADQNAEARGYA